VVVDIVPVVAAAADDDDDGRGDEGAIEFKLVRIDLLVTEGDNIDDDSLMIQLSAERPNG
jgi:hypothetical protein